MEKLMKGQRACRIFATAGKVVAAINSGYKAIIRTPNGSTEVAAIVRCKDCINRGNPKKCLVAHIGDVKSVPYFYVDNSGEFYCADGKRKE